MKSLLDVFNRIEYNSITMNNYDYDKRILPEFPKTQHLPIEPNAQRDDLVVSEQELDFLLGCSDVDITEKIDGSNCAFTVIDGYPVIRNRNHILNKAYTGNNKTPAKMQFAPIWTWYYNNIDKFTELKKILGFTPGVYGEWMFARHTVLYDKLPNQFIAFDIYNYHVDEYISPKIARSALIEAGFSVVPLIAQDIKLTRDILKQLRDGDSAFSSEKREGMYIKVSNGEYITHRYKMVRSDFKTDEKWNKKPLVKNKVIKY